MRPAKIIFINSVISLALILGVGFLGYFYLMPNQKNFGDGPSYNDISALTATQVSTAAGVNTQVLAANSGRKYARIQNISDTAIFISFMASTSVTTLESGIRLNTVGTVGDTFVIDNSNLYRGVISATSSAASKTLLVIEE